MISDDFSRLYLSISYLMTEQTDKAIVSLQVIAVSKDINISPIAKWYLALAYLQKGLLDKAKPLLIELQNNSPYSNFANEVLNKF
jgi:predicted negative regulator of RcsB-dependent stress response